MYVNIERVKFGIIKNLLDENKDIKEKEDLIKQSLVNLGILIFYIILVKLILKNKNYKYF